MTPQRAGWLIGLVVFVAIAGLGGAVTATTAEALSLALRAVLLAVAAGVLVACIAASTRGRGAAIVAAGCAYLVSGVWSWLRATNSPRSPEEDPGRYVLEHVAAFVSIGTALAVTAALVAWWVARNAVGRDSAERVLALETTSLRGSRDDWGAAMRAELASIDDPKQRVRFARSLAFRHGTGWWPPVLAAFAGIGAGVVVFSAAQISFERAHDRGILGEPIMGLVLLLLVAAVLAGTLIGSSFRAGLETAVLAWLAVYVCTVAVEIPQALAWYHDEGILLLDGEPAAGAGVDALGAALQPITHSAFIFVAVSGLVVAVLTAALGAMLVTAIGSSGRAHRWTDRAGR